MRRNSSTNELFPSLELFPRGFAPVVESAHAAGFRFGVYTSAGNQTCHASKEDCNGTCNLGSLGHYTQDAQQYADWSMDFMKMDWCSASVARLKCEEQYAQMAAALNATGREIAFYMSCGGGGRKQKWASEVANIWRIGNDHLDCWTDGPCSHAVGYRSNGHGTLQVCIAHNTNCRPDTTGR
jgi:alpha-galactosidase